MTKQEIFDLMDRFEGGTLASMKLLEDFKARTEAVLGAGSCHVVTIRPVGGVRLA